jgi:hypothetical protein
MGGWSQRLARLAGRLLRGTVETGDDEETGFASEASQLAPTLPRATGGWSASASASRR